MGHRAGDQQRVRCRRRRDERRQEAVDRRGRRRDHERADATAGQAAHRLLHVACLRHQVARHDRERPAGGREHQAVALRLEQCEPKVPLQRLELTTERGLCDAQLGGGRGDRTGVYDREKSLEPAIVHPEIMPYRYGLLTSLVFPLSIGPFYARVIPITDGPDIARTIPEAPSMATSPSVEHGADAPSDAIAATPPAQIRKVASAAVIGTALEWYDFFLFGTTAAIVFAPLFFPGTSPVLSTISAFLSFGVGFLARPIGAAVFGHIGDKFGRRGALVGSVLLMGAASRS